MGILFISISAGIVILAFLLIIYFRRNKTAAKNLKQHSILEKKAGENEGIYD